MPLVSIGDVLDLEEDDYRYGTGPLILRVTRVADLRHFTDGAWISLCGMQLRTDGTSVEQREVLVRVATLRARRRSAG
jgi:hypothetical protein